MERKGSETNIEFMFVRNKRHTLKRKFHSFATLTEDFVGFSLNTMKNRNISLAF